MVNAPATLFGDAPGGFAAAALYRHWRSAARRGREQGMSLPPETNRPPRRPSGSAGGVLIALGAIIGPVAGLFAGSATAGFLVGAGTGAALATAMWVLGQRR